VEGRGGLREQGECGVLGVMDVHCKVWDPGSAVGLASDIEWEGLIFREGVEEELEEFVHVCGCGGEGFNVLWGVGVAYVHWLSGFGVRDIEKW